MAREKSAEREAMLPKLLVWLHGEIKTPPFSAEGRQEAGMLLRQLQNGERLGMPHSEPLPGLGKRCGALRIPDGEQNWRIMYRVDPDAILILEVYSKKTRKIPDEVMKRCRDRMKRYDEVVVKAAKKQSGQ